MTQVNAFWCLRLNGHNKYVSPVGPDTEDVNQALKYITYVIASRSAKWLSRHTGSEFYPVAVRDGCILGRDETRLLIAIESHKERLGENKFVENKFVP